MSELFGISRAVVKPRYALIPPDGLLPSGLPGWKNCGVHVSLSPLLLGPRFTQLQVGFEADGVGEGNTGANQYFAYVVEGAGSLGLVEKRHRLEAGSFAYLPPGTDLQFKSNGPLFKLLIYQKPYHPLAGAPVPPVIVGHQKEVKPQPWPGNPDIRVQPMLPAHPAFDLAVNLCTFAPGAAMPLVETSISEHGLLLLKGQGICRLDGDYHPVRAGDAVWAAAYCSRWFAALGRTPAVCVHYHDTNRDPM